MIAAQPISSMTPGRDYWAVPWAMTVDLDGRCHLSSCTDVHEQPVGTSVRLRLRRENDGLHVHVDRVVLAVSGYRWNPERADGSAWFALSVDVLWIDGKRQAQAHIPDDLVDHPLRAEA